MTFWKHVQNYILYGIVQIGQGDGAKLGTPTANLALEIAQQQNMVPGLYLGHILVDEKQFEGLIYYGINSLTKKDCLEVHLRDFKGVLYDKTITVTTTHYLREARFFDSREALRAQIQTDLKQVGWIA